MTYADLVARLQAAIVEDPVSDDSWAVYLPAVIEQAELRCYRDCDFLAARKTVTSTLAQGVAQFAAPSDWLIGERVDLVIGGARTALLRREDSFVREYGIVPGRPLYWSEPTQATLLVAPVPDSNYTIELSYHYRPTALGPSNTVTWLSSNVPDLLFYASMVAAAGYQKNFGAMADDPRSALSWDHMYQTALQSALREEGRRKGETTFDHSPSPQPSSSIPATSSQG